jgi:hypothetical protein
MKNIINILVVFFFLLLGSACNDYLQVKPENQLVQADFWKKESDVEAVVRACYRSMEEKDFMWRVIVWGELRSDNVITNTSSGNDEQQIDNVNILSTNGNCNWQSFYTVINDCNVVLKYAPDVMNSDPNFKTADLQAKEAEVLAIRALCYFYLVRTFRDVPLSTEATVSDNQNLLIAQSSPDVVLKKITDDLLQAESWALDVYPTPSETKGRMTKDAIRAILADVYLWRNDYANCITYCDKLINATTEELSPDGTMVNVEKYPLIKVQASGQIFSSLGISNSVSGVGNSSESIFELQFSTEVPNAAIVGSNGDNGLYGNRSSIGSLKAATQYVFSDNSKGTSVTLFPKTDTRRADFVLYPKTGDGFYQIFKYLGIHSTFGTNDMYSFASVSNWIFYRITDIMLMKAEALTQQGAETDLRQALQLVNTTYMRSNATLTPADTLVFNTYNNVPAMESLVSLERQRELMFEGKRWFDLVRNAERKQSTNDLVASVTKKYTSNVSTIQTKLSVLNALYLPIYENELNVNTLLKQNPYYQVSPTIVK